MKPLPRQLLAAMASAAALLTSLPATAAQHGPAPVAAKLNEAGPYEVNSYSIPDADAEVKGYGGGTVYYPKASSGETFGIVAMMPGFLAFQAVYAKLVQKIASHGFIVASLDSVGRADFPEARSAQLAAGLAHVAQLARGGQVPYASVADPSRRAIMGNSMGGGAALSAMVIDPTLKAAVALQPWHTVKSFPAVKTPTLIVACQTDGIAPNKTHSDVFYASLPGNLPRAEIEVKDTGHLCATFLTSEANLNTMGKSAVAWLKRFLDEDMRYDPMVKGGINQGEFSRFTVEGF
ncbi:MAG: alpha/beta hydrolase [Leptothrix sp. (in: Bacteria)]|nr:alpha/beta hydrolase [Leptothrix sp. (in: b-proteobacteria)]